MAKLNVGLFLSKIGEAAAGHQAGQLAGQQAARERGIEDQRLQMQKAQFERGLANDAEDQRMRRFQALGQVLPDLDERSPEYAQISTERMGLLGASGVSAPAAGPMLRRGPAQGVGAAAFEPITRDAAPVAAPAAPAGASPFIGPKTRAATADLSQKIEDAYKTASDQGDSETATKLRVLQSGVIRGEIRFEDAAPQFDALAGQVSRVPPASLKAFTSRLEGARKDLQRIAQETALPAETKAQVLSLLQDLPTTVTTREEMARVETLLRMAQPVLLNPNLNAANFGERLLQKDKQDYDESIKGLATLNKSVAASVLSGLLDQENSLRERYGKRSTVPPLLGSEKKTIELIRGYQARGDEESLAKAEDLAGEVLGRMQRQLTPRDEQQALTSYFRAVSELSPQQASDRSITAALAQRLKVDHLIPEGVNFGGKRAEAEWSKLLARMPQMAKLDPKSQSVYLEELRGMARATGRQITIPAEIIEKLTPADQAKLAHDKRLLSIQGKKLEVERALVRLGRAQTQDQIRDAKANGKGGAGTPKWSGADSAAIASVQREANQAQKDWEGWINQRLARQKQVEANPLGPNDGSDWRAWDPEQAERDIAAGHNKYPEHKAGVEKWRKWKNAEQRLQGTVQQRLEAVAPSPTVNVKPAAGAQTPRQKRIDYVTTLMKEFGKSRQDAERMANQRKWN